MREFERIDRMTKLINKIWKNNPDLRLLQLIGNCFVSGDLYYKEDSLLESELKKYYTKGGKKK